MCALHHGAQKNFPYLTIYFYELGSNKLNERFLISVTVCNPNQVSFAPTTQKALREIVESLPPTKISTEAFGTLTNALCSEHLSVLKAFRVTNANAAVRYFQLFNQATAPVNDDVPVFSLPIPAGTANAPGLLTDDLNLLGGDGLMFAAGLAWGISTTEQKFTDSATAANHTALVLFQAPD